MRIERDRAVALSYVLKGDDGAIIDQSQGDDLLWYLQGHQNIIVGLERALEGKQLNDSLDVTVEPGDGYGERSEQLVFEIPKEQLPQDMTPARGDRLQVNAPNGGRMVAQITKVKLRSVEVDANHELAGQRLHFAVTVKGVRKATKDELAHGHVHGPGGHHHH